MVSEINVWVWLSLVEYLNGVQGVGGSNPLTQTSKKEVVCDLLLYCFSAILSDFQTAKCCKNTRTPYNISFICPI